MSESNLQPEMKELTPPLLPDQYPTLRSLDPAASLAYRTPIQEHPPAADLKAGAILTASGILATLTARFSPAYIQMMHRSGMVKILDILLLIASSSLLLGAIWQAFRTISPRFPRATPSLAFFGDIARLSRKEYLDRVLSLSHEEALREMLTYNHTAARICVEKFQQLRRGIFLFRYGVYCWLLLLALIGMEALWKW